MLVKIIIFAIIVYQFVFYTAQIRIRYSRGPIVRAPHRKSQGRWIEIQSDLNLRLSVLAMAFPLPPPSPMMCPSCDHLQVGFQSN